MPSCNDIDNAVCEFGSCVVRMRNPGNRPAKDRIPTLIAHEPRVLIFDNASVSHDYRESYKNGRGIVNLTVTDLYKNIWSKK